MKRILIALFCLVSFLATPAAAQVILPQQAEGGPTLPDTLSPDMVDGMLSRLTDAEIRMLLREELVRRADEQAQEQGPSTFDAIDARLTEMQAAISERVPRWLTAIANIDNRFGEVAQRSREGDRGLAGTIVAGMTVVALSFGAALVTLRLTRPWRVWLASPQQGGYWDKVVRTIALGLLEGVAVVVFLIVTNLAVPLLSDTLGRLSRMHWIYSAGVTECWTAIIVARRAFAPDAPQIRIAPLTDAAARDLYRLLRQAALIILGGWMLAGLSLHAGFGFPPAMLLNAAAGTIVAALLMTAIIHGADRLRAATAVVFASGANPSSFGRIVVAASPVLLGLYVIGAWGYWLALWLENGRHHLAGPLGTVLVYLVLPIVDRLGAELAQTAIRADTDVAARFRGVLHGFWRLFIGVAAVLVILWLWGLNLVALAASADAPAWTGPATNIAATLLVGYMIWRLIRAALHTERRISDSSEDVDPSEVPAASRLDTLTPLFRNVLLFFLGSVIMMIVLSALGVDIGPLIASAGILGIALGFGAQALVRDVLSGVFFLIDDAFRVGEYIELDKDMRGEVENITVRSLQLRHHRGPVITIPFGELRQITNHNRDWVIYKMMFRMEPDTDPQRLKKVVKRIGAEFMEHPVHGPKFIEPLKSQGVYYIDDDSALVIRLKFKCKPRAQFVLRRDIYHRMRVVFEEEGFRLARKKVEVVGPDDAPVDDVRKAAAEAAIEPSAAGPAV